MITRLNRAAFLQIGFHPVIEISFQGTGTNQQHTVSQRGCAYGIDLFLVRLRNARVVQVGSRCFLRYKSAKERLEVSSCGSNCLIRVAKPWVKCLTAWSRFVNIKSTAVGHSRCLQITRVEECLTRLRCMPSVARIAVVSCRHRHTCRAPRTAESFASSGLSLCRLNSSGGGEGGGRLASMNEQSRW